MDLILGDRLPQKALPKAQRTRGMPALTKITAFKVQLQNLDQTLASKSWPNLSFRILNKLHLQGQNLNQTFAKLFLNVRNIDNINKFWVGTCKGPMYLLYFKSEKSAILYKLSVCKFWHRCLCYLNQQICYFSQLFALRLVKSWEWWRKTRRLWKNRSLFNILLSWSHSDALNKTRGTLACLCLDNKSKYCLFWNLCLKIVVFRHSSW